MLMREAEEAEKSVYRHIGGCNSGNNSGSVCGHATGDRGERANAGGDRVSKVFGGSPKMPAPAPAEPSGPSAEEIAAQETARRKEVEAARKAKGRSSTLLTGGQGVVGPANTQRKQLLGA